ncbi:TIGR02391 family protein [Nocardia otitidiscaviarum]|uniref:TIGR02391 family protein n=1 Tax=Nocardia otitidiscaviarum TaxID=1823 RepID=UPI002453B848|nr:TIGR02391 family protein [Nocardia otitidiscaviarum]
MDDGSVLEFPMEGVDLSGGQVTFAVDADVEVGDELSWELPSGKTRTIRLQSVDVMQSPLRGTIGAGSLDHTSASYEVIDTKQAIRRPPKIDIPGLHHSISAVSGSKFAQGHHDAAVFEALKAVEHRVQSLTGSKQSGKPLMTSVFNEQKPQLDTTSGKAAGSQRGDELEGFKFLFMGASQGLRNPRGHGGELETPEDEAREMLALASLLMRMLDRAEQRRAAQGGS